MLLLVGSFLVLMLVGVPVAISMASASILYLVFYNVAPDIIAAQRMIAGVESFPLLAVPFFILAGNLMNSAGVTGRIYSFAVALVGWMKGGLAQVNIIGSVIFSGMSGTALADAAGIGTIEIKAMKDHGYPVEVAVGVTAASATLGPIFPPSLPFVIYGMMANVSIGALFMAGIVPGVIMTVLMMVTVAIFAYKRGWGSDTPFEMKQLLSASIEVVVVLSFPVLVYVLMATGLSMNISVGIALVALLALDWYFDFSAVMALMTPIILIGGMTMGWFTPTEAAVAAVLWSLFLGLVRYRTMTMSTLARATFDTIETTASVLFIVTAASIFAWLLTVSQAAQLLSGAILSITDNSSDTPADLPSTLNTITRYDTSGFTARTITLGQSGATMLINGVAGTTEAAMGANMIMTTVGAKEIWTIKNSTQLEHSFHLHDVPFQVISINGTAASGVDLGWKDTVEVIGTGTVVIAMEFTDYADDTYMYMLHCHLAQHEDEGMMAGLMVTES